MDWIHAERFSDCDKTIEGLKQKKKKKGKEIISFSIPKRILIHRS